ncbi:ABC transporter ATP-binding protein [Mycoplasmopsis meleagridis]|uniref:ABC transporter ATP-binding protein n=1 Tax=Mycoplasmopsis meleagridis TaxID=29561 RepID=UPI003A89DF78
MPRLAFMQLSKNEEKLKLKELLKFLKRLNFNFLNWLILIIIGALIPLSSILASFLIGYIVDSFFNNLTFDSNNFEYKKFILYVSLLALCYAIFKFLTIVQRRKNNRAVVELIFKLRIELYEKIQSMPISYFDNQKIGNLMSTLTNDVNNILQSLIDMLSNFLIMIFQFLIIFIIMFLYAPILASIAIVSIPLSTYILYLFIKNNQKYFIKQQNSLADFNAFLEEIINAIPLIRLHNQEEEIIQRFEKFNRALIKPDYKSARNISFTFPFLNFAKFINLLIIISVGVVLIFNNINVGIKPLTTGLLITFSIYIMNLGDNISQILEITNNIQLGLGGITRVNKILNLEENKDKYLKELDYKEGVIEFNNVNFYYPTNSNKQVLHNINFKIEKGQTIALVGKTGSGKTTIAKLLSKFYLPSSGTITIDNQNSADINENSWRKYINTIMQDVYIFNASLRDNLTLFNKDIDDIELKKIISDVIGDEFINDLPNGLDTILESNAKNISQGQKQLISIIRALINATPIIILDEATSDIDTITEIKIKKMMDYLINNCSSLVIAHRLSTVVNADKILVIDEGKIIEQGSHEELMKLNGYYKYLYTTGFPD